MGPVRGLERELAPDLARGLMLALIALANSVVYLYGRPYGVRQHIVEEGMLDRLVSVFDVAVVDGRAYPMFAALFAYGVVRVFQRQRAAGVSEGEAKRLLRRRSRWLIVFGFVHVVLLFPGDVLGLYGVLGFVLVALIRVKDRTLLVAAASWSVVVALVQGAAYMMPSDGERSFFFSFETTDPLEAMALRPLEWLMTPLGMLGVGCAALVGTWAARRGVITDPARHRALLTLTAAVGLTLALLGGLPAGLAVGGFWEPEGTAALWITSALHGVTGIAGGLGYAALIGLVALRIGNRRGPMVLAITACGERSLSCYLFQSVVFVALLSPYTLGLGETLGTAEVAVIALATWVVSVLLADLLRQAGVRGPAEVLLRRLTYRTAAR
ncbi:putative membrane protein YeiB [Actinokineospora cianjurensis]|uniref:Putative membrane protein YeiB n=1 Tax=Actinokineospora cianjurensis TaxID=585224 RepID=A0A421B414_9PSEU|nr:putative membrane protein YeiB [Actinokineospora cianjurensis]